MDKQHLTDDQASTLRNDLQSAMAEHTKACLRLARGLFESYYGTVTVKGVETPLYNAWGFESWDEYVENELSIHMGTARSYVRVHDELVIRRDFPEGHLPNSISKLRLLARVSARPSTDGRELNRLDRTERASFRAVTSKRPTKSSTAMDVRGGNLSTSS
jgi:hypothetical protein